MRGESPFHAFLNLFSDKSYHVQRFVSMDFSTKIKEILSDGNYDIVQLETLFLAPYIEIIRKYSDAKIVLRAHNIEHLIWDRVASETKNPFKKFYVKHLAKTLKSYELNAINKFDGLAAITKQDAGFFLSNAAFLPIIDLPFGIDTEKYIYKFEQDNTDLFHIGAMNWIPNQEGVKWFLQHVWQLVINELPELNFYLAGRTMPNWLLKSKFANVHVIGEVENAISFIQSKGIMIVPLFSGSGIRIKIIEAMALGKVVITTTIGAEGLGCTNKENILIADNATEYKHAIIEAVSDGNLRKKIAENARFLIVNEHENKVIINNLISFYKQLINK